MPKIFEVAKSLDIGALDLVEKLKGFGFEVKNHMSVLSDEQAQKALELLQAKAEKKAKKKVVKKKKKVTIKKVIKKTA